MSNLVIKQYIRTEKFDLEFFEVESSEEIIIDGLLVEVSVVNYRDEVDAGRNGYGTIDRIADEVEVNGVYNHDGMWGRLDEVKDPEVIADFTKRLNAQAKDIGFSVHEGTCYGGKVCDAAWE